MSKHTPGPWHLAEVRHADVTPHGFDGIIRNADNDPVASVGFAGYSERTAFANALLIAAAPDLLAATKAFVAWLESDNNGPGYGSMDRDSHPDGELIWRRWWDDQRRLCDRALDLGPPAIRAAEGEPDE